MGWTGNVIGVDKVFCVYTFLSQMDGTRRLLTMDGYRKDACSCVNIKFRRLLQQHHLN